MVARLGFVLKFFFLGGGGEQLAIVLKNCNGSLFVFLSIVSLKIS